MNLGYYTSDVSLDGYYIFICNRNRRRGVAYVKTNISVTVLINTGPDQFDCLALMIWAITTKVSLVHPCIQVNSCGKFEEFT